MTITVLMSLGVVITVLMLFGIIQKRNADALMRKKIFIETQQKKIQVIEDIIKDAKSLSLSPNAVTILLARIKSILMTMIDCFPTNPDFRAKLTDTSLEIDAQIRRGDESVLPTSISEAHAIQMVKILRRVRSVLALELSENNTPRDDIFKEMDSVDFIIAYLTINNIIMLADLSYNSNKKGTARERYEAATRLLNKIKIETNPKWIEDRLLHCQTHLQKISDEMLDGIITEDDLENNANDSTSISEARSERIYATSTNTDDGLGRVLDWKKRKIVHSI